PNYFKHAVIQPLLKKKPNLDPLSLNNYRPISKLSFLSKVLGSILGSLLFSIYMLPLSQIIQNHDVSYHCYVDDTQLYVALQASNSSSLDNFLACLSYIKCWMSQNFLKLNDDKSEVIIFGQTYSTSLLNSMLGSLSKNIKPAARNLGVIFDVDLCFEAHVKNVVQSCFFQLKKISKIRSFLSPTDLHRVIHAFIFSQLDYCNALYAVISQSSLHQLQLVQNAAA
ncbi:hypothetical protein LDENG_00135890, partial [Lucifuga dentata]